MQYEFFGPGHVHKRWSFKTTRNDETPLTMTPNTYVPLNGASWPNPSFSDIVKMKICKLTVSWLVVWNHGIL